MSKSRFRIIALRPITPIGRKEETIAKLRNIQKKVFGEGWMCFYGGYKLTDIPYGESDEYGEQPLFGQFLEVPDNPDDDGLLYDSDSLAVNLCAVIGPNGSGKSSAVELMIRILNNFSVAAKGEKKNHLASEHLFFIENVYGSLVAVENGLYFQIQVLGRSVRIASYKWNEENKCFECGQMLELLSLDDKENTFRPIEGNGLGKIQLYNLFYTAIFNYSMYAFNYLDYFEERTLENRWIEDAENKKQLFDGYYTEDRNWLKGLFHKNDGYQTPIVLNPMRVKGIIDVPRENRLAAERVRNMLFYKNDTINGRGGQPFFPFRMVNGHLEIVAIKVKPFDNPKFNRAQVVKTLGLDNTSFANDFDKIRDVICRKWSGLMHMAYQENTAHEKLAWDYVLYKTLKIIETYDKFEEAQSDLIRFDVIDETKIETWLRSLFNDNSHVTLKLRQALNFLKFKVFREHYEEIIPLYEAYQRYSEQLSALRIMGPSVANGVMTTSLFDFDANPDAATIKAPTDNDHPLPLIYVDDFGHLVVRYPSGQEIMPPPIFDMTLILIEKDKIKDNGEYSEDDAFPMSGLSSGERQIAGAISNFTYHLANIDSVWEDKNIEIISRNQKVVEADDKRNLFRYKYVNVVFDEVELYFHPDLQRRFVKHLVDSLNDLHLEHVEGLNIQLITHSPFVLSDIPDSNILCLSAGDTSKPFGKTFAANIHDLFNNRFILPDTIGELAKTKILELVSLYDKQAKEWRSADDAGEDRRENKEVIEQLNDNHLKYKYLISIIGDDYLQKELGDMLDELVEFYFGQKVS